MTRDLLLPADESQQYWVGVASADHVALGRSQGFMQVSHGKAAPLHRLRAGDGIVYYSPVQVYGGTARCQAFTAIGVVTDDIVYQADMGRGFTPCRRAVTWSVATQAPIQPLLDQLDFTRGKKSWGYALRFGLIKISRHDMQLIADAMGAKDNASVL